jgi:PAS domain-containing protein
MSLTDAARRWGPVVERLKTRLGRSFGSMPPKVDEAVTEALKTCEFLLQELATCQIENGRLIDELKAQTGEWAYLFDQMPVACVVTDSSGGVIQGNQAAAELLNMSARHLENRPLTYFVQDRDEFFRTLERLPAAAGPVRSTFTVRPRERAPLTIDFITVPRAPQDASVWMWFLTPSAPHHCKSSSSALKPGPNAAAKP